MGKVATQPLLPRRSPPLQSGGLNQKWPTCGQGGYVTPAASGIPSASERGAQKWPTCGQGGYVTPAASGIPTASERGAESEVAHLWARWLLNPLRLGDPHRFRVGATIKWATSGQGGYVTPAASGVPTASERGAESEVAHLWARWLLNPCRLGDPLRFRAGGRIRSGPLVGKGYLTPAAYPHRFRAGGRVRIGLWAYAPRLGDPHRFRAGGRIRSGPLVGKVAT